MRERGGRGRERGGDSLNWREKKREREGKREIERMRGRGR